MTRFFYISNSYQEKFLSIDTKLFTASFYLQMAFFLGLPTSNEVEKFLNFNGYTIKSPFRQFPNTDIYDYDVCRYIDAGISYDLINSILEYEYV